jgi:hypothetical protein
MCEVQFERDTQAVRDPLEMDQDYSFRSIDDICSIRVDVGFVSREFRNVRRRYTRQAKDALVE